MKVGDLVQCLPARIGVYIIIGEVDCPEHLDTSKLWMLRGLHGASFAYGAPMGEKFIEVISESR